MDLFSYLISGIVNGLGAILPLSAPAHDFLYEYMTGFDSNHPLMKLMCHLACLISLWICLRHKISYLFRELRLYWKPARQRRRQPDLEAVLDGKFLAFASVMMILMLLFRNVAINKCSNLPALALMLTVSGIILFLPQFSRTANRDSRHMSRKDSLIFGLTAGLSTIPGFSLSATTLSVGSIRGMDKRYALDCMLLISIPALVILSIMDLIAVIAAGFSTVAIGMLLYCLIAGVASFFSSWIAVLVMKFLSVNTGYSAFAYYNWGLAIFAFILYLMV